MGKGWKLEIECGIRKRGIHDNTERCRGWRAKECRKGVLAWKIGQCLYLWLRIGGVLSDIDTELMEVCYWGEGQEVGWKKTLNRSGSKGFVR